MVKCTSCKGMFDPEVVVNDVKTRYTRKSEGWEYELGIKFVTTDYHHDLCGWCLINHYKAIRMVMKYQDRLVVNAASLY